MEEKNILLGIHSGRVAGSIAASLAGAGISADIKPYIASEAVANGCKDSSSQDIRMKLSQIYVASADLKRSVQIAEQSVSSAPFKIDLKLAGRSEKLLIPVDFSDLSILACRVGFELAIRLGIRPVVLHVYTVPYLTNSGADTPFPSLTDTENVIEETELQKDEQKIAQSESARFKTKLDAEISAGRIAKVDYDLLLEEGTPEEAILEYTKLTPPALVVMATRGKDKKDQELIGSVTAEVLDSCRVPVFTVPENYGFSNLGEIRKLAFFCNLDGRDIKSMEFFMRMFNFPEVSIMLVPASAKIPQAKVKISELSQYFATIYPESDFNVASFPTKEFRTEFEEILQKFGFEMLMVPNKRSNVFARLFKPGIPHRVLFERDIPMLALPV